MELPIFDISGDASLSIPFFDVGIAAGAPSYVSHYFGEEIDLNAEMVKHPGATFCVRVSGQSMIGAGIDDGDLLIVDKALQPEDKQIVLAVIDGDYTVKRLKIDGEKLFLMPENPDFDPIPITAFMDFRIWGVVTGLIKKMA